jgi:hypothetical protein
VRVPPIVASERQVTHRTGHHGKHSFVAHDASTASQATRYSGVCVVMRVPSTTQRGSVMLYKRSVCASWSTAHFPALIVSVPTTKPWVVVDGRHTGVGLGLSDIDKLSDGDAGLRTTSAPGSRRGGAAQVTRGSRLWSNELKKFVGADGTVFGSYPWAM